MTSTAGRTLSDFQTPDDIAREALLAACESRLALCSEEQRAFFHRVFGPPSNLNIEKLRAAVDLCARTIVQNDKRAALAAAKTGGA